MSLQPCNSDYVPLDMDNLRITVIEYDYMLIFHCGRLCCTSEQCDFTKAPPELPTLCVDGGHKMLQRGAVGVITMADV